MKWEVEGPEESWNDLCYIAHSLFEGAVLSVILLLLFAIGYVLISLMKQALSVWLK